MERLDQDCTRRAAERGQAADQLVNQLVDELGDEVALPVVAVDAVPRIEDALLLEEALASDDAVSKLKRELEGEIVVPASFQLVRTLMEHDLVDELRLKVFPVALGAGARLFGDTSEKKPLRLVGTRTVEGDVVFLTHEVVREA